MSRLAYTVGKGGHAFCPAFFIPDKQLVFMEQMLFVLEFNGTITFKEVANRARQLHLPMLFAYRRFASTVNHERFCVSFLLDSPVPSEEAAWGVRVLLRIVFPESEMSDVDTHKIYFGGDYSIFCDKSVPLITTKMLYNLCCQIQSNQNPPRPGVDYCALTYNGDGLPAFPQEY